MHRRLFAFNKNSMSIRREIGAAITSFLSMCYILAVNPAMFELVGMPADAVFIATALTAAIGTLLLAFIAKMPFGIAPAMGINAFIVFTVCLTMGHTWNFALTAVLIEGLLFLVLTLSNILEKIDNIIPLSLKNAICAGIGLYIGVIGLQSCGILTEGTPIPHLGTIASIEALLAAIGLLLIWLFYKKQIKGSILWGALIITIVGIPAGITSFETSAISRPHLSSIAPILFKFEWSSILSWDMLTTVVTLAFIDIFSIMGTFVGLCSKAELTDNHGNIPSLKRGFLADSLSVIIGSCLGITTSTVYIESGAGVLQGGRSGVTSVVIAICFAAALIFSPLFLAVPAAATAPILIFVGISMLSPVKGIFKSDWGEWAPALICITLMPILNSISDGIFCGIIAYTIINFAANKRNRLHPIMYVLSALFLLRYLLLWF